MYTTLLVNVLVRLNPRACFFLQVFVTIRECDEEIIEYVFNNGNPFIFSFDSDFIISNINASVLSASKDHFNLETMTTRLLDRRALMEHLGLRLDQLPLLAILIGNDIIDPRLLIVSDEHSDFCGILQHSLVCPLSFYLHIIIVSSV